MHIYLLIYCVLRGLIDFGDLGVQIIGLQSVGIFLMPNVWQYILSMTLTDSVVCFYFLKDLLQFCKKKNPAGLLRV